MIKINSNDELLCPDCGNNYTHHSSVNVIMRDSEDGPGTSAISSIKGVAVSRVESSQIPGRRDVIEIQLWCEQCGSDDPKTLRIMQHKGNTEITWQKR